CFYPFTFSPGFLNGGYWFLFRYSFTSRCGCVPCFIRSDCIFYFLIGRSQLLPGVSKTDPPLTFLVIGHIRKSCPFPNSPVFPSLKLDWVSCNHTIRFPTIQHITTLHG